MPQVAYELDRFAPSQNRTAQVRVAKRKRAKTPSRGLRMVGNLFLVSIVLALSCGVLYSQTSVNELQTKIAKAKTELAEQDSLNAYLTLEMENISNVKEIEEKAISMGMVKVNGSQITYIQVQEGESIEVKETMISKLMQEANTGLLSVMDYFSP